MKQFNKANSYTLHASRYANNGFTLIELMIAMMIIAALTLVIYGNFFTSLKKGRDARRIADLEQIQQALELYYEVHQTYPTENIFATYGDMICNDSANPVAGSCSDSIILKLIPNDPQNGTAGNNGTAPSYVYCSDGDQYQLYAYLENTEDPRRVDPADLDPDCGNSCGSGRDCNFGISSPNVNP